MEKYTHYHQVVPERACEAFKARLGRLLGLNMDWGNLTQEAPLDEPVAPVIDFPGQPTDLPPTAA